MSCCLVHNSTNIPSRIIYTYFTWYHSISYLCQSLQRRKTHRDFWGSTLHSSTSADIGIELNPREEYITNEITNGKQCTIVVYVDDNEISHVDLEVVTSAIDEISKYFGALSLSRGNEHDFLGMDIELKDVKVYFGM